jgi:peptidyl-prolyl cis-trans isomerase B (cyclophilin B)
MTTTEGTMTFRLRPDHAPNTVWNFRTLVEGGFYTDIVFHRIIGPSQGSPGFMAQVGDPTGTGGGGPGYVIDLENSKLPHDFGVLSMARTGDPNTNGSQVFVCFSREGTQGLDGLYCSFAQAVSGAETILKLGAHPTEAAPSGEMSKPKDPAPRLVSARLVDAPPLTQQPAPVASPAKPAPSR